MYSRTKTYESLRMLAARITQISADNSPAKAQPALESSPTPISCFTLNDSEVYVLSSPCLGLGVYKMLNYVKPQAILLDQKPLGNSAVHPSKLLPSFKTYKAMEDILRSKGLFWGRGFLESSAEFGSFQVDKLSERTLTYVAMWSIQHELNQVYLGDLCLFDYFKYISANFTLQQLRNIFTLTFQTMGFNPDIIQFENQTPFYATYSLNSNFVVPSQVNLYFHLKELTKKHSSVFCILQDKQVDSFMSVKESELTLEIPTTPRQTSLVRTDSSEVVMEKLALINVLYFGKDNFEFISQNLTELTHTIEELVSEENKESKYTMSVRDIEYRKGELQAIYLTLVKRFSSLGVEKLEEGKKMLHKQFLKEILN